jgi:peroxidase
MQSGGGRYNVQTGRRDGFESLAINVDLPSPTLSVPQSIAAFARKGLTDTDMVYLLGTNSTFASSSMSCYLNKLIHAL